MESGIQNWNACWGEPAKQTNKKLLPHTRELIFALCCLDCMPRGKARERARANQQLSDYPQRMKSIKLASQMQRHRLFSGAERSKVGSNVDQLEDNDVFRCCLRLRMRLKETSHRCMQVILTN